LADELQLPQASLPVIQLELKERRRHCMRVADPKLTKSRIAAVQKQSWTGIRSHFIRTVKGAAPTEGVELIRKWLPSRKTAYWNSTVLAATIRVWKRTWGNACHRVAMRCVECNCHQFFVNGDIEKFFSISTPARLCAAMIGYLDAPTWARETAYIYIRILSGGRPKSGEGNPFPIGRKLGFRTGSVGRLRMVTEVKKIQFGRIASNIH
jgi:hypothetical protein